MHVGLFIPCYIDQFYPQVGIATLELLEKLGCKVDYPGDQTCCGQPLANSGYERDTVASAQHFLDLFAKYDYVVAPSGSCVLHVKEHFPTAIQNQEDYTKIKQNIWELSDFIHSIIRPRITGSFPHRIGFLSSCHGLRGLRLAAGSELNVSAFHKTKTLFEGIKDLEWVELDRPDECCGFGGTFAVAEEALSIQMGKDRLADYEQKAVEIITGGDVSCLMHLEGIAKRQGSQTRLMHFAEILNQAIS